MEIGATHKGCRFWGYEPKRPDGFDQGDYKQRVAKGAEYKEIRERLKAAGYKPTVMGCRRKEAIISTARIIEEKTGIEMTVFNHDYL